MAVPDAAFANRASKAARGIKSMRLAQPPTARVATNGPANSRSDTFQTDVLRAITPGMGPASQARIQQGAYAVEARPLCSRYVPDGVPTWLSGATAS
jgi:hypothetical protein